MFCVFVYFVTVAAEMMSSFFESCFSLCSTSFRAGCTSFRACCTLARADDTLPRAGSSLPAGCYTLVRAYFVLVRACFTFFRADGTWSYAGYSSFRACSTQARSGCTGWLLFARFVLPASGRTAVVCASASLFVSSFQVDGFAPLRKRTP